MNELKIFESAEFGQIRTVMIDGEPWLVGKDVAKALGYMDTKSAISDHVDGDDKQIIQKGQIATLEIPNRGMTIINESGLYSLIFGSKLESAKRFKHWVTSEVLPAIRKTGSYGTAGDCSAKKKPALSIEEAFRMVELINGTPGDRLDMAKAILASAGIETLPKNHGPEYRHPASVPPVPEEPDADYSHALEMLRGEMGAIVAARLAYLDAENEDIPSKSPSNKQTPITGTCLADGTEIVLDQDQGTVVNSFGVATAINRNGFRPWGSYTGAWPASGDAKDVWLNVRRMFIWHGNTFIQTYFDKVDDNMNRALIDNIIDSENIRCASYAPQHWAGASIEYLASDNPATSILAGEMKFRQHIAPYTPAQTINNILNYDIDTLTSALTEG